MIHLLKIFLALLAFIQISDTKFTICSSIRIQGAISIPKLAKIQNCTIIIGHIRILNAKFLDLNSTFVFPNLIEITDYLLIFQIQNIDNIGLIFPKLSIIRGHNLFKDKALIVFMANSLTKLNLKRLIHIDRGSILVSRLYHACYINTIDWNHIIKNGSKPLINLNNNECLRECEKNCWSELSEQIKCSSSCETNCDLENSNKCCSDQNCLYCSKNKCLSCSKYRDITDKSGNCVEKCPSNSLSYENSICIKVKDCSLSSNSLVKSYFVIDNNKCVKECPVGYRIKLARKTYENITVKFRECQKCSDEICKIDCVNISFHIEKKSDLNKIKNCYRVKSLILDIDSEIDSTLLKENFLYLEEIQDFLIVTRNKFLTSLNFLNNLRKINGKNLFENKYSLFIHSNQKLRDLWPTIAENKFQLETGAVKFFENPDMCYQVIENFLNLTNLTQVHESDVSFNFNGYRRLTCSEQTFDLNFELRRKFVKIYWNVTVSDLRRLKGFSIYFRPVFDEEIDFSINADVFDRSQWQDIYIQYSEVDGKHLSALVNTLKPFTRYAIYVKADVIFDYNRMGNKRYSSQNDKLISNINFIRTLPSKPGLVEQIEHENLDSDKTLIKWSPSVQPNGIIESYFISYTMLEETQIKIPNKDRCHIEPNSMSSESKIKDKKIIDEIGFKVCPFLETNQASKKIIESEQDEIISIEDEIFNLALRPVRPFNYSTKRPKYTKNFQTSTSLIHTSLSKKLIYQLNSSLGGQEFFENRLLAIIKKDLFILDEQILFKTKILSNNTFNFTLSGLKSFTRYLVSIIACQNFSNKFFTLNSIEDFCSKPKTFSFRSARDESVDRIPKTILYSENGLYFFKWTGPTNPNGIVLRYNLKFVDLKSNKTYGPLCHSSSSELNVALNQFLLTEGRTYSIKVQIVTTAGYGPWSTQLIKYTVPSLSDYYTILFIQIGVIGLFATILLSILFVVVKKYFNSKEDGYFNFKSHYYYFRPDEWEVKRENLTIGERIGSGCFAEVHKGTLLDSKTNQLIDCAIKFCGSDHQNRQRLLKEANMLKSIDTTHIVKLLGVISKENPAYLILEYMDNGDLKEYLRSFKNAEFKSFITTERFYRMAAEIADGMLWLSEHKYIHRDLAARNCLISKENVIKISDLGLGKDIYQNPVYREKCKSLLPIRWMSPESLKDGSSTTKSDVWSYGVLIWEMTTYGENPYSGKENEEVIQFVKNGGRLKLPTTAPLKFNSIFNKCMLTEDFKRICFKEILDILDPDLTSDFKQKSYYHSEFRKKCSKRKNSDNFRHNDVEKKIEIVIAEPCEGDLDNYM